MKPILRGSCPTPRLSLNAERTSLMFRTAAAAAFIPSFAHADAFDTGMNTLWEVLWHQSGIPTRLVRWEQPELKVSITGFNAAAHKQHTLQALRDVAGEAGLKVADVSDRPDAARVADVRIQITPDSTLSDEEPCVTQLHFQQETKLDWVEMQMRDGDARRCAYHEAMHVMGVRGHPE